MVYVINKKIKWSIFCLLTLFSCYKIEETMKLNLCFQQDWELACYHCNNKSLLNQFRLNMIIFVLKQESKTFYCKVSPFIKPKTTIRFSMGITKGQRTCSIDIIEKSHMNGVPSKVRFGILRHIPASYYSIHPLSRFNKVSVQYLHKCTHFRFFL